MPQHEKFICISYSAIDFLIPNAQVFNAVGIKDFDEELMCGSATGIYSLDALAEKFGEKRDNRSICTMIMLKTDDGSRLSLVTASECKVRMLNLAEFSLFSDFYAKSLLNLGIMACFFGDDEQNRVAFLVDIKKMLGFMGQEALL